MGRGQGEASNDALLDDGILLRWRETGGGIWERKISVHFECVKFEMHVSCQCKDVAEAVGCKNLRLQKRDLD